jgi:hypothetical protein
MVCRKLCGVMCLVSPARRGGPNARTRGEVASLSSCPVSLDLARRHLADLRRTTSPETPSNGLSHLIWSAKAILSAVSH